MRSTYRKEDVEILLTDLTGKVTPVSQEERQRRHQQGEPFRSIMIEEYPMSSEYALTVRASFWDYVHQTGDAVASVAEQIYKAKGNEITLVSIVRAGVPAGILIKRYLNMRHPEVKVHHYGISLIDGLDPSAMRLILSRHPATTVQFVDGWTGKGTVARELLASAKDYPVVDVTLAVLSDVTGLAAYAGTRQDIAIPIAPMNACAAGLISITVDNEELQERELYHGAMFLEELAEQDCTATFLRLVENEMLVTYLIAGEEPGKPEAREEHFECPEVAAALGLNMKLLNPGVNEAARAILRRKLDKLLVCSKDDPQVQCIMELAELKGATIEEYPLKYYKAISIAKE